MRDRALPLLALLGFMSAPDAPAQTAPPFATFQLASEPVLNDPHDLTMGPDGRLYIADKFGGRIVVMDPDTLALVDVIDEGRLPGIHDIAFGPDGKAYAAVTGANAVATYAFQDGRLTFETFLGPFPRTEGALAHSNGRLYVMASGSGDLMAIRDGEIVAFTSGLWGAHDVAEAPDGSVWVADNNRARLVRFSPDLEELQVIDGFGMVGPRYLDVDPFGRLVVADQDRHQVLLIEPLTEELVGVMGDGTPGMGPYRFDDPEGALVHGNAYYFADSDNNRIVKYVVILN